MPDPSTVLLIGAGGLVGHHLLAALGDTRTVATYRRDPVGTGVRLDITDHESVRRAIRDARPDVIILAAAEAYVERCEREPAATRRVNVDAARVIADESQRGGSLLVVFSSEYVFDGTAGQYSEQDERRPLNEYGRQKVELEDVALATGRGLVCRTSGVFGVDPARRNFVCQLVDSLRAGRRFDVASDQLITPTYAPALAAAVVRLAEQKRTGILHVAGPRMFNRRDFAELVAAEYGLPSQLLRFRPTDQRGLSAPRPLRCGLQTDTVRELLGEGLTDPAEAARRMAAADVDPNAASAKSR